MRYVLGVQVGPITIPSPSDPSQPQPALADLTATYVSNTLSEVVLNFPAFDPAASQPPAETLACCLLAGQPAPADADGWVAQTPYGKSDAPVPPEGAAAYSVPLPALDGGSYVLQVVHGYPD